MKNNLAPAPPFLASIMTSRVLAPCLSDVDGALPQEGWQKAAMAKVQELHDQAFQKRALLTPMVMQLPSPAPAVVVHMVASLAQKA